MRKGKQNMVIDENQMSDRSMNLPTKPHPIVNAFTQLLKNGEKTSALSKKSSNLYKVSQVLGWRNRFSQSEYYPVKLSLSNGHKGLEEISTVEFKVKQVQRGEVDNTYGTGATVWPASLVLTKYLEHLVNNDKNTICKNVKGLNICDLGAGTGVTSIAAANMFDDALIICTDGDDNVVELCRDNVKGVATEQCHNDDQDYSSERYKIGNCSVRVCKYWWGDGTILKELQAHKGASASFDVVLVSDCVLPKLYPIAPLVDALDQCISSSTVAYCTYEHRFFPEYHPKDYFIELCAKRGLEVTQVPIEDQHSIYSVDDIEVWQIRKT